MDRFTADGRLLESTEPNSGAYYVRFDDYQSLEAELKQARKNADDLLRLHGEAEATLAAVRKMRDKWQKFEPKGEYIGPLYVMGMMATVKECVEELDKILEDSGPS